MSAGEPTSDQHFMALALEEGAKGIGLTAPNPSVGAVLVRDGEVLGKGFHSQAGQPHAEIEALTDCRRRGNDPRRERYLYHTRTLLHQRPHSSLHEGDPR